MCYNEDESGGVFSFQRWNDNRKCILSFHDSRDSITHFFLSGDIMGRIPYLETPQNALQLIRPRHREIMRRLVCGQTQREIAEELSLNEGRLSIIINSPLFKVELKKMEKDVRARAVANIGDVSARVAKMQGPALDVLEKIITNKTEKEVPYSLKRAAAMDVLELAGAKKNKNEDGMNDFAQFISEAYAEAKQRALNRLDHQLEAAVEPTQDENFSAMDMAGDTLPLDEAEDVALANAKVVHALTSEEEKAEQEAEPIHEGGNGNGNGNGGDAAPAAQPREGTESALATSPPTPTDTSLNDLLKRLLSDGKYTPEQIKKQVLDQR